MWKKKPRKLRREKWENVKGKEVLVMTARHFYVTFAYEIYFYGIYFYEIYIYEI
jgi:hypothetical protein